MQAFHSLNTKAMVVNKNISRKIMSEKKSNKSERSSFGSGLIRKYFTGYVNF